MRESCLYNERFFSGSDKTYIVIIITMILKLIFTDNYYFIFLQLFQAPSGTEYISYATIMLATAHYNNAGQLVMLTVAEAKCGTEGPAA